MPPNSRHVRLNKAQKPVESLTREPNPLSVPFDDSPPVPSFHVKHAMSPQAKAQRAATGELATILLDTIERLCSDGVLLREQWATTLSDLEKLSADGTV